MVFSGNKDCPCRECTTESGRHIACHDSCQKYKDWQKIHYQIKDAMYRDKAEEGMIIDHFERLGRRYK